MKDFLEAMFWLCVGAAVVVAGVLAVGFIPGIICRLVAAGWNTAWS